MVHWMDNIFWEMIEIFSSIAQKIWLSNFWSPSLMIVGDQKLGIEFFGQFLEKIRETTKMFWVMIISFQSLDQLPLLIRLLFFFWHLPKLFLGKSKKLSRLIWSPKVDDQIFLITQFND